MPELLFETTVTAPIERVWGMYQEVETVLRAITPPEQELVVERVEPKPVGVGTRVRLRVKTPVGRVAWVARIVEHVPPHGTITGVEARFVDQQEQGPFKRWRHTHEFEAIDDGTTRVLDLIEYAAPYGPIGWIADRTVVTPALKRIFAYRQSKLRELLA